MERCCDALGRRRRRDGAKRGGEAKAMSRLMRLFCWRCIASAIRQSRSEHGLRDRRPTSRTVGHRQRTARLSVMENISTRVGECRKERTANDRAMTATVVGPGEGPDSPALPTAESGIGCLPDPAHFAIMRATAHRSRSSIKGTVPCLPYRANAGSWPSTRSFKVRRAPMPDHRNPAPPPSMKSRNMLGSMTSIRCARVIAT